MEKKVCDVADELLEELEVVSVNSIKERINDSIIINRTDLSGEIIYSLTPQNIISHLKANNYDVWGRSHKRVARRK